MDPVLKVDSLVPVEQHDAESPTEISSSSPKEKPTPEVIDIPSNTTTSGEKKKGTYRAYFVCTLSHCVKEPDHQQIFLPSDYGPILPRSTWFFVCVDSSLRAVRAPLFL